MIEVRAVDYVHPHYGHRSYQYWIVIQAGEVLDTFLTRKEAYAFAERRKQAEIDAAKTNPGPVDLSFGSGIVS